MVVVESSSSFDAPTKWLPFKHAVRATVLYFGSYFISSKPFRINDLVFLWSKSIPWYLCLGTKLNYLKIMSWTAYIFFIFSFVAAVYDPNVHSFYDEPLPYPERYHKYTDFKDHKPSYRDGEFKCKRLSLPCFRTFFFAEVSMRIIY